MRRGLIAYIIMLTAIIAGVVLGQSRGKLAVEDIYQGGAHEYVFSGGDTLSLTGVQPVNVLGRGVTGDGTTDDADSLNAVIAAHNYILIPPGTYRLADTLEVANSNTAIQKLIIAHGATFLADTTLNGPIIRLGSEIGRAYNITWEGGRVAFPSSARDWDQTAGFQLYNLYRGVVREVEVWGAKKGIELTAGGTAASTAHGCVYNTVSPRYIVDCAFGLYLKANGDGWVNENTFIGDGQIMYSSTLIGAVDCSGYAAVYALAVGNSMATLNNNKFYGLSFECGADPPTANTPMAVYLEGQYNLFSGCRFELFNNPHIFIAKSGATAPTMNYFLGNYMQYPETAAADTTLQRGQFIGGRQVSLAGGNTAYPLMVLKEINSAGNVSFELQNTANTPVLRAYATGTWWFVPYTAWSDTAGKRGLLAFDGVNSTLKFYDGAGWQALH